MSGAHPIRTRARCWACHRAAIMLGPSVSGKPGRRGPGERPVAGADPADPPGERPGVRQSADRASAPSRGRSLRPHRVARLMRAAQLWGRQRRRFRVRTTDSQHDRPIAPNLLLERAPPTGADQVWVSDITYVHTARVGSFWPRSWICTAGASSAGRWRPAWRILWCSKL